MDVCNYEVSAEYHLDLFAFLLPIEQFMFQPYVQTGEGLFTDARPPRQKALAFIVIGLKKLGDINITCGKCNVCIFENTELNILT